LKRTIMNHDELVAKIAQLDQRVTDLRQHLNERLEQFKSEKRKTWFERLSDFAAFVSLGLGLIIAAYTIRENAVTKPEAARQARTIMLQNTIDSMLNLVQQLDATPQDSPAVSELSRRLQKLTSNAAELVGTDYGIASAEDLMALGDAFMSAGQAESAMHYFAAAAQKQGVAPRTLALAKAKHAGALCATGNVSQVRSEFEDAIKALSGDNTISAQLDLSSIYIDKARCECSRGMLDEATASKTRAFSIMDTVAQSSEARAHGLDLQVLRAKHGAEQMLEAICRQSRAAASNP
jgi:tetratricopeptide (TPR) repeat protein